MPSRRSLQQEVTNEHIAPGRGFRLWHVADRSNASGKWGHVSSFAIQARKDDEHDRVGNIQGGRSPGLATVDSEPGESAMKARRDGWLLGGVMIACTLTTPALAQDDQAAELAKKLANPVAALTSVPIAYDRDDYGGANEGAVVGSLIVKPVVPFSLSENWNLITRTIIPFVDKDGFPIAGANRSGLGDITASQFFSPKSPTAGGWIWGAGPILLLPTASDDALGAGKWGLGPTAVVLKQTGPWTVGFLGSHIWSVAGGDHRPDISTTALQPFLNYTTRTHTTFGASTESAYDWERKQWSVPVIVQAAQLFKIGPQVFQLSVAGKYWANSPADGARGWGLRVQLSLLFPR